ncbi:Crp/Fnr family transcriptional regulator [Oceanobacter mangrovi]|uniref:Crp/Fnr family transcriptional regulator n=1 Tax=Oceanobacter mangrovi TaxID=2862510 RepID=UPI001C8E19DE|nr:Crp/Fnr family transcriptional regulator [Oceanobacter mangrovi]
MSDATRHPHAAMSGSGAGHTGERSADWLAQLPEGQIRQFDEGDVICRPDNHQNRIFLIQQGCVRICLSAEHKELTLGWLRPGSIYVTHTRAWVEALEPTRICSWPIERLTSMIAEAPELAIAAMREVGMMLHQATNLIEDLAFRPVDARLARYLLLERGTQNSDTIQLTGHTELLASLLGTSRQTLSTSINRMIKDGLLNKLERQQLQLLDIAALEALAQV